MSKPYRIVHVEDDASQAVEAMGTKPKFWYFDQELGRALYKQRRPGTGEDWAEKIAAELAGLLGLPHARVELAEWLDTKGIVTPTFVPEGGALVHGNEILTELNPWYPGPRPGLSSFLRVPLHTVELVLTAADVIGGVDVPLGWHAPCGISGTEDVFVGYLLLDAWIGNTDRHHENWGWVIKRPDPTPDRTGASPVTVHLAPTYDHASSLGRNEPESRRRERLTTKDSGYSVSAYVEKARSALYATKGDERPLTVLGAFSEAARLLPHAANIWVERLKTIQSADVDAVLDRIPRDRISAPAVDFAREMLMISRRRSVETVESQK